MEIENKMTKQTKEYIIICSDGMVYNNLSYSTRRGADKKAESMTLKENRGVIYYTRLL